MMRALFSQTTLRAATQHRFTRGILSDGPIALSIHPVAPGVQGTALQESAREHYNRIESVLAHWSNVGGFGTLIPLSNLELDFVAFAQALESLPLDSAGMNEHISRSVRRRDESVPLGLIEPLDRTFHHNNPLQTAQPTRPS